MVPELSTVGSSAAPSPHVDPESHPVLNPLQAYIQARGDLPVQLHLGCGGMRWKDFINVDLNPDDPNRRDSSRSGCVADVFADMRDLGLPDNSVEAIFTSHTIDHFSRWVAVDMLSDWHRMLRPGGTLTIEAADLFRCILWLFHPSKRKRWLGKSQLYGNQWDRIDYETHRYVWSGRELKRALREEIGFREVTISHRTETHVPGRDMRAVARK
jgi:predicted SAM-dependent methyltransferase